MSVYRIGNKNVSTYSKHFCVTVLIFVTLKNYLPILYVYFFTKTVYKNKEKQYCQ